MGKTSIVIQKAAKEIPKPHSGRPRTVVYPFEALGVNESFIAGKYSEALMQKVSSNAYYYGKKLDRKFVLRNDNGHLKVWREK